MERARVISLGEKEAGPISSETDDDGFLKRPEMWTKSVADTIAAGVLPRNTSLGEDHWKVIDYLREYYIQFAAVPPVRMLCKRTGIPAPYLRELFPTGLINGACKIAGIPRAALRGILYP